MYSTEIQNALKKANVKIGDRISVVKGMQTYEGLLMPRIEIGDTNSLVLKLDSGYNIGIKYEKDVKISKSRKPEPRAIKEEIAFETGKEKIGKISFDKSKPSIAFILTGGTIVSRVDYKTGGVAPLERPEELLANVPELQRVVNITDILTPIRKASEDFDYKDWQNIAETASRELNKNQGVIIAHGTDTMHYTSAALSFMLKNLFKPVVLVGSQRSSDRGSSDAQMNLICSAYASISDIGEVGICMHSSINDDFCTFNRGTRVMKLHKTRRDTFGSFDDYPLANIWSNGKIEILNQDYRKRKDDEVKADTKFEPKVAIIRAYPNSDPEVLNWYVSKGYKGFVIEGTGMGHVPTQAEKTWIPLIKKITKDGIPIVITSQAVYGRINTNVYANLRTLFNETGAIAGEDMLPHVSLVKLGWVIAHYKDLDEIRKVMTTNIAGEITERSLF